MSQPALFGELMPTLEGHVQGIVGKRPVDDKGRHEWDLQCSRCAQIETILILPLMQTRFFKCIRDNGYRMCPDCHTEVHNESVRC